MTLFRSITAAGLGSRHGVQGRGLDRSVVVFCNNERGHFSRLSLEFFMVPASPAAGQSGAAQARDTEEGPPRTEGVVPLGGRREATQGGQMTFASFLSFSTKALSFQAVCILYFICSFRRESAGISSAASNIRAEVVVTGRLPFSISLSTEYPIPILSANFLCEMPRSSNSSFKTSPG